MQPRSAADSAAPMRAPFTKDDDPWHWCAVIAIFFFALAWHRLDAWSEAPNALKRLSKEFLLAPVSNGNISLMVDLARRNDFPWDAVLGAEVAGDYKPKPRVYIAACEAFDLEPAQCMMVAAHPTDLSAAAACGLHTAYIDRPLEHGAGAAPKAPVGKVIVRSEWSSLALSTT